jgi:hypothetical protein
MSESGSAPYQTIPEPLPISVAPSIDERARKFLRAVTLGQIDRSSLSERLNAILPTPRFAEAAEHAAALGTVEGMYAFEQRTTAEGVATYYRVRYSNEIWTWVVSIDHAGSINGFALRRSPRYKIFNIWLRDVTY